MIAHRYTAVKASIADYTREKEKFVVQRVNRADAFIRIAELIRCQSPAVYAQFAQQPQNLILDFGGYNVSYEQIEVPEYEPF